MKSPSDSSISQPEEPTDVQSAIPKSATGLLSPLNLTSHPREASQNEIATLLRNADSLVPDAAGRGSSQHSIESTESTAGAQRKPLPTEVSASQPVDLTGVFRMVSAADLNDSMSKTGAAEEHHSAPRLRSGGTEETGGFTKMFQSLSASTVSDAAQDFDRVRANEASSPTESLCGSPGPAPHFDTSTRNERFTELPQYLDRDRGWGESRSKRDQASASVAPQMEGGFTQLLRTLSKDMDEPSPERVMPEPAIRSARDSDGPGEFTRIISDSMLREAQGRTSTPVPVPEFRGATPSDLSAQGGSVSPATPEGASPTAAGTPLPQATKLSQSFPPQQETSQSVSPQSTAPHAPTPAAPSSSHGSLQRYVPLLLIVNVFLMLLVLLALGIVITRH
ncbi:hypothetical protein [Terriglobus saanensis]|uniref:Uncharacterized protein n=1 Tax=Terriglobus saanensis (strain ATCC BAA-1853 / DSM 23119 / SP1PR4) TaxID=401053 RepID=E8UX24_TERSS|nr:hypothetical protein [Terriglobus saanensis]ADV81911.1 hypothetical protein AciPR4_1080 [Terriglobus saanensis SP1PR4]